MRVLQVTKESAPRSRRFLERRWTADDDTLDAVRCCVRRASHPRGRCAEAVVANVNQLAMLDRAVLPTLP
jgi:hypothetical protein